MDDQSAQLQRDSSSILTINGGSSSIKFAICQVRQSLERGLHGKVDRIGLSGTNYAAGTWGPEDAQGLPAQEQSWPLPTELASRRRKKGKSL